MKQMKKAMIVSILAFLLVCVSTPIMSTKAAKAIKLNKTKTTLIVKGTTTLKLTGTTKKVTWSSNKKEVATVDKTGKVTAKKAGTAKITAKVGNKKYTCTVTVKKATLDFNELFYQSIGLYRGESYKVNVSNKTGLKITWSTKNSSIATVNSSGKVTGKKLGSTQLIAKCGGRAYTFVVEVIKPDGKFLFSEELLQPKETKELQFNMIGNLTFTSSDPSVVEVVKSGERKGTGDWEMDYTGGSHSYCKIKAKKKGIATIRVKMYGYTFKCKVTVDTVKDDIKEINENIVAYAKENKLCQYKQGYPFYYFSTINWRKAWGWVIAAPYRDDIQFVAYSGLEEQEDYIYFVDIMKIIFPNEWKKMINWFESESEFDLDDGKGMIIDGKHVLRRENQIQIYVK